MPYNVEIKARLGSLDRMLEVETKVQDLCLGSVAEQLKQNDTFYNCTTGRLKLREEDGRLPRMISYQRADSAGPKLSEFQMYTVTDVPSLKSLLESSLGVRAQVKKNRKLYIYQCKETGLKVRIHLDIVEKLGEFLEFEVNILKEGDVDSGTKVADELMLALCIAEDDLIQGAYVDLLSPDAE